MSDYIDLIQKEKEAALAKYDEEAFRSQLERNIADRAKPVNSYIQWFRKPAVAGSSVFLMVLLVWLSTRFFPPPSQKPDYFPMRIALAQMLNRHENILNQNPFPAGPYPEKSLDYEFQWSLKRVILAIQRENASEENIVQNLRKVIQNSAIFENAGKQESGELNI
jgi:hypothetical protein